MCLDYSFRAWAVCLYRPSTLMGVQSSHVSQKKDKVGKTPSIQAELESFESQRQLFHEEVLVAAQGNRGFSIERDAWGKRLRRNVKGASGASFWGRLKAGYIAAEFIGVENLPHRRLKARELGSELGVLVCCLGKIH